VPADHPLLALPNMVVTPHIAAGTADNFATAINQMFRNMASITRGEPIPASDLVVG
jgi:phosphoglycerate dehydrogenase-like enzyme